MQALSVSEWFNLIQRATDTLMNLVLHVKVMFLCLLVCFSRSLISNFIIS